MPNSVTTIDSTPPWEYGDLSRRPVTRMVKALANEIFQRICSETYSYGTRLPSERELSEEFNVSRNTVRRALDLLKDYEIVAGRPGSGSVVAYRPDANREATTRSSEVESLSDLEEIAELTSPLELNVVRTIIEPEMVRLAVINMSARDIAKLRDILSQMDKVTTNASEFAQLDEQFHMQLSRGTRNPLLIAIYHMINRVRNDAQWVTTKEKTYSPQRIKEYKQQHRSIFEAIQARDIESAVELIKLHMTELQRDLVREL